MKFDDIIVELFKKNLNVNLIFIMFLM